MRVEISEGRGDMVACNLIKGPVISLSLYDVGYLSFFASSLHCISLMAGPSQLLFLL